MTVPRSIVNFWRTPEIDLSVSLPSVHLNQLQSRQLNTSIGGTLIHRAYTIAVSLLVRWSAWVVHQIGWLPRRRVDRTRLQMWRYSRSIDFLGKHAASWNGVRCWQMRQYNVNH